MVHINVAAYNQWLQYIHARSTLLEVDFYCRMKDTWTKGMPLLVNWSVYLVITYRLVVLEHKA